MEVASCGCGLGPSSHAHSSSEESSALSGFYCALLTYNRHAVIWAAVPVAPGLDSEASKGTGYLAKTRKLVTTFIWLAASMSEVQKLCGLLYSSACVTASGPNPKCWCCPLNCYTNLQQAYFKDHPSHINLSNYNSHFLRPCFG